MHFGDYLNVYTHAVVPLSHVKPVTYFKEFFFLFSRNFFNSSGGPINRSLKKLQTERLRLILPSKPVIPTTFNRGKSIITNVIEKKLEK